MAYQITVSQDQDNGTHIGHYHNEADRIAETYTQLAGWVLDTFSNDSQWGEVCREARSTLASLEKFASLGDDQGVEIAAPHMLFRLLWLMEQADRSWRVSIVPTDML